MVIKSRLRYFFLLFRILLFTSFIPLAIAFPYFVWKYGLDNFPVAMRFFFAAVGLFFIYSLAANLLFIRWAFQTILVTDEGIQSKTLLGRGSFYYWHELSGYDTGSHSMAHTTSFEILKIFRGKHRVILFDEASIDNFEEMKKIIVQHLDWYPNGPKNNET